MQFNFFILESVTHNDSHLLIFLPQYTLPPPEITTDPVWPIEHNGIEGSFGPRPDPKEHCRLHLAPLDIPFSYHVMKIACNPIERSTQKNTEAVSQQRVLTFNHMSKPPWKRILHDKTSEPEPASHATLESLCFVLKN